MEAASRAIARPAWKNPAQPDRACAFAAIAIVALCSLAQASSSDPLAPRVAGGETVIESYDNALKGVQTIDMLGADLFGEETNLSNGATAFAAVDVSLATNSGLPVSVGRKLVLNTLGVDEHGGAIESGKQIFGQYWELDVPYMRGVFDARAGWTTWAGTRCSTTSGNFAPPGANGLGSWSQIYFEAEKFWSGNWINIPGHGEEELRQLQPDWVRPSDGASYLGATRSEWRVACHPSVQNGPGEGFVVALPDG
ncbi:MAG: hypothetical protein ABI650_03395, partial [Dokdonella sp.]